MEQDLRVEGLGQDEDLAVELGTGVVAWVLALPWVWIGKGVEEVGTLQVWVPAGPVYAHRAE